MQTFKRNNPGNIRYNPSNKWQGQIGEQGGFVIFDNADNGIRAMVRLLYNYKTQGIDSTQAIISRYAPGSENNTASYIRTVSNKIGKQPSETLQTANDYYNLIQSMIKVESGQDADAQTLSAISKYLQYPVVQEISVAALAIGAGVLIWIFM